MKEIETKKPKAKEKKNQRKAQRKERTESDFASKLKGATPIHSKHTTAATNPTSRKEKLNTNTKTSKNFH